MRARRVIVLLLCASCVPEEGPLMAPGRDCVECHGGGEAQRWTAAGTWSRGAHVAITDANGKTIALRGNKVGNFYTAEPLAYPLTVSVDGVEMATTALRSGGRIGYGGCNLCHVNRERRPDPALMAAGRDCLQCHDGNLATRFYAAGTWSPGATIVVRDADGVTATAATVANGNFYIDTPLRPPFQLVQAGGSTMSPPPDYGGCNACHGTGGEDVGDD